MAQESAPNVVLLAIKPFYAQQIMARHKKVEFRKIRFQRSVQAVVVYASNPIKQVIGWFEVAYIEQDDPKNLWRRHRHNGGISHDEFFTYFNSRKVGFAIGVGRVRRLRKPLRLNDLSTDLNAPQSFVYLPDCLFENLKTP